MKAIYPLMLAVLLTSCTPYSVVSFKESEYVSKVFETTATKDELFIKANRWLIGEFRDAKNVTQYSDKEAGVIIGRYVMHGRYKNNQRRLSTIVEIYSIVEITVKENKARIEVRPTSEWAYMGEQSPTNGYSKKQAINDINLLCDSFGVAIRKPEPQF